MRVYLEGEGFSWQAVDLEEGISGVLADAVLRQQCASRLPEGAYWLSIESRPLVLAREELCEGAVVRVNARGTGGGDVTLRVKTKFGFLCCCNHCTYDCCSNGRNYEIRVNNIHDVSAIFDAIAAQNPSWRAKNATGVLMNSKNLVMEPDRKLLFYDVTNNEEITLIMTPNYWFTNDFRKGGLTKEDEEDQREWELEQQQKRAAAAGKQEVMLPTPAE